LGLLVLENAHKLDAIHPFPPAELPNFLKGLEGKLGEGVHESVTELSTLGFIDAGANLNVPYVRFLTGPSLERKRLLKREYCVQVPLMRRQIDLVIALDASADSQDLWFA